MPERAMSQSASTDSSSMHSTPEASTPAFSCPIPVDPKDVVLSAHGGGGLLMQRLIRSVLLPALDQPDPVLHDAAELSPTGQARLAFTTDSSVVRPLFFPGGDIGRLAVFGTVNDLAMTGARPLALSCSLILEEGTPFEELQRVMTSMGRAAQEAGTRVVTGDTKTVEHGSGDGIFITTAGIGIIEHDLYIHPRSIQPGDAILVSGDIARHGSAIALVRHDPEAAADIPSDLACLWSAVAALLEAGISVRCLRDLTRGGLTAGLCELAAASGLSFEVRAADIPVDEVVAAATELLGLDPMHLACEGRMLVLVPNSEAATALQVLQERAPGGAAAAIIGAVTKGEPGLVTLESTLGTRRILDQPAGEALPRIC